MAGVGRGKGVLDGGPHPSNEGQVSGVCSALV